MQRGRAHREPAATVTEEILAQGGDAGHAVGHIGAHVGDDGVERQVAHGPLADGAVIAAQATAAADLHHAHAGGAADGRDGLGRHIFATE